MKAILFAAVFTLGTAAAAQTGNTVNDPSQASGSRGITQQGTNPEGQPCTPPNYNAGASAYPPCPINPAHTSAAGATQTVGTHPPCSKTVTDHCIQTYERGVRRR